MRDSAKSVWYRPQSPQNTIQVGHLLRIPEVLDGGKDEVKQDEFRCLNLNVSFRGN